MFSVRVDLEKNRLYLKLGKLDREGARAAARAISKAVWKLKPGFTLLNDITQYETVSQEVAVLILGAQKVLAKAGLGKGVRVAKSALAAMQFDWRSKEAGIDVITVGSPEEAESILDTWEKKKK